MNAKNDENTKHRFLDESGDTAFFGPHKTLLIGKKENASLSFLLGMVKFKCDLVEVRESIRRLEQKIINDKYFAEVPSIQKRALSPKGFCFHATDDPPEVRKEFYEFIKVTELSFECVVGRKNPSIFIQKHHSKEPEFYADLLSHLLKNKLEVGGDLVLNVAERGNSTKNANLQIALQKAIDRFHKKKGNCEIKTRIVFNVQNPCTEPLLCVADYLNWAVQRVFEKGEVKYYNYIREKYSMILDIYDESRYERNRNYYSERNPLTPFNKLSPPSY